MNKRTIAAAALAALAVLAPAAPASAHQGETSHGATVSAAAHKHGPAKGKGHAHRTKKVRTAFQLHGTVTAVDAGAGTLTFTVRGGRHKDLRRTSVTVTVAANAKVVRDDAAATLWSVAAGDHVSVKGLKVDAGYTAYRVSASSRDGDTGTSPDAGTTPVV